MSLSVDEGVKIIEKVTEYLLENEDAVVKMREAREGGTSEDEMKDKFTEKLFDQALGKNVPKQDTNDMTNYAYHLSR